MTATNTLAPGILPGLVRGTSMDAATKEREEDQRIGRAGIKVRTSGKKDAWRKGGKNTEPEFGEFFGKVLVGQKGLRTGQEILDALVRERIGCPHGNILRQPEFSSGDDGQCEARLVRLCPRDIGFNRGALLNEFFGRVLKSESGLGSCSPQIAPLLLLRGHRELPSGRVLLMGLEPIWNNNGKPVIVGVAVNDNGPCLRVLDGYPHLMVLPAQYFLFESSAYYRDCPN